MQVLLANLYCIIDVFVYSQFAGYVANFRVDCRDKTTVAAMMRQVLDEFNIPGSTVYADNLFVSVEMLRWCNKHGINLCGTTRRSYGFPQELDFGTLPNRGDMDWRMTEDGLLAVAWRDVGQTKSM